MSDLAIRVDHLSKRYPIGALQQRHDTTSARLSARLRDAIRIFDTVPGSSGHCGLRILSVAPIHNPRPTIRNPKTSEPCAASPSREKIFLRGSDPLAFDASSPQEF